MDYSSPGLSSYSAHISLKDTLAEDFISFCLKDQTNFGHTLQNVNASGCHRLQTETLDSKITFYKDTSCRKELLLEINFS